jgi:hypothetical protein
MAGPPAYPDSQSNTGDDPRDGPERGPTTGTPPGTPRLVKVFGIVALVLVLVVVIVMLAGGDHGSGRHLPSGGAGGHAPPVARGVQPPSL